MTSSPRGTPRLASAYPDTPQYSNLRQRQSRLRNSIATAAFHRDPIRKPLPANGDTSSGNDPVISFQLLDAASQRGLAITSWVVLWILKFYAAWALSASDDPQPVWTWLQWLAFDTAFIYGLPAMRIPWLQWSATTMTLLVVGHAIATTMLMFQIGLPLTFPIQWIAKQVWETEMAISERRVKPQNFMDRESHIQGSLVINKLPEGTALLNPFGEIFCIGGAIKQIEIPIQINQTDPVWIDILRRDFDMSAEETFRIKTSEINRMKKAATSLARRDRSAPAIPETGQYLLRYPVKKPGQYTILNVADKSNLKISPRPSEVIVVACPSAKIKLESTNRCRDDVSDISFEVEGTPPLRMKYRKLVNGNPTEASFQSIQPDNFASPLRQDLPLVKYGNDDITWAASRVVSVPINEVLKSLGQYSYVIDEVQDALGNSIQYHSIESEDDDITRVKYPGTSKFVTVHDRPSIWIPRKANCNAERPLKVASGRSIDLPHRISSVGRSEKDVERLGENDYRFDGDHYIEYEYTPEGDGVISKTLRVKKSKSSDQIIIKDPGLYKFKSIRTDFCAGEVVEPSACLLENPPKPNLHISSNEISHKCANSPIGLLVDLDFEGTPPFDVHYVVRKGSNQKFQNAQFYGHRGQVRLEPHAAGQYEYAFIGVEDSYYEVPLDLVLKQDVKPSASAMIEPIHPSKRNLCLGESASFEIHLYGEEPWTLEYELIQGKSRKKVTIPDITNPVYTVNIPNLTNGGEYILSLSSVTDKSGCKEFLKDEEDKFQVWSKLPTAAFGPVNGKHSAQILEGNTLKVPLKFTGQLSYNYQIKNLDTDTVVTSRSTHANGVLEVDTPGTYRLEKIADGYCDGIIDSTADKFQVEWIGRPSVSISQHPTISGTGSDIKKQEVCEGDEDNLELAFQGSPPFDIKYEEHAKLDDGSKFLRRRDLNAARGIATVQLDTSKAGSYQYKFLDLADANYDVDARHRSSLVVQQQISPRPTAKFTNPGRSYNYCSTDDSDDQASQIPITLTGVAPFDLEVDIKYAGSVSPESITFNNIPSNQHNLQLPRQYLRGGVSHLTIRRVKDSRGCRSKVDPNVQLSRIQVSVHDPPHVAPVQSGSDFCEGDRLSFRLSGVPPFTVFYTFDGKATSASSSDHTFTRLARDPGKLVITGVSDSSSKCKYSADISKIIHPLPVVRMSDGRDAVADIHEGGETEILFEFTGTAPFEFTFTRSDKARKSGGNKYGAGEVLETKTERTEEHSFRLTASEEGRYDVVSVRDKWCGVSKSGSTVTRGREQKLLT